MDRKSIIILAVCFVLLAVWFPLMNRFYPPPPPTARSTTNTLAEVPSTAIRGERPPDLAPAAAPRTVVADSATEQTLVVSNDLARYTFTSLGGGLKSVELLKYPETVGTKSGASPTNLAMLNGLSTAPILSGAGSPDLEGDGVFRLTRTATGARAEKALTNGLVLVKEFDLSTNYLVQARVRLTNASAQTLALSAQAWIIGTATPMNPQDNGMSVGMIWYNGAASADINQAWFDNRFLGCFPGTPRSVFIGGNSNVVWAAVHNQFFALAAVPHDAAESVACRMVELPRPSAWLAEQPSRTAPLRGFETALIYPARTLAPGQVLERQFYFFAGPKAYRVLERLGNDFGNDLERVMGFSGFFGWFAKALLLSMNGLQAILHLGYGWIIILITIIIKLAFWPLTQASTRSMKRMQALQPQMNALKEKYKDDPAKMNQKLMEFMKENKVSPLGGCLPMVIQLPIFFGFYRMIQSAIELRGERFLWVKDLAQPDTLFRIHLGGFDVPFNLLPLIMGGTMLWQSHLTPAAPGTDPIQQKMMKYMPLLFLFMLYNFSAGLTLYWTVQNLLSILQMKLTRSQSAVPAPAPAPAPRRKK